MSFQNWILERYPIFCIRPAMLQMFQVRTYSDYLASMPLPPDVLPVMAIKTTDIMQYVNDLLKSCKRKCNRDNHSLIILTRVLLCWVCSKKFEVVVVKQFWPFSCQECSCFESMIAIWASFWYYTIELKSMVIVSLPLFQRLSLWWWLFQGPSFLFG